MIWSLIGFEIYCGCPLKSSLFSLVINSFFNLRHYFNFLLQVQKLMQENAALRAQVAQVMLERNEFEQRLEMLGVRILSFVLL